MLSFSEISSEILILDGFELKFSYESLIEMMLNEFVKDFRIVMKYLLHILMRKESKLQTTTNMVIDLKILGKDSVFW